MKLLSEFDDLLILPRQNADLETAWLGYPLTIRPGSPIERAHVQQYLDANDVDTRTIWTGNVTRQPMLRGATYRTAPAGLPNTDAVMERGFLLPCNHGMGVGDVDQVVDLVTSVLEGRTKG